MIPKALSLPLPLSLAGRTQFIKIQEGINNNNNNNIDNPLLLLLL